MWNFFLRIWNFCVGIPISTSMISVTSSQSLLRNQSCDAIQWISEENISPLGSQSVSKCLIPTREYTFFFLFDVCRPMSSVANFPYKASKLVASNYHRKLVFCNYSVLIENDSIAVVVSSNLECLENPKRT